MWSPTHVQVTVCRVKGLLTKGKSGTNDAFVTIGLGKEKFQTSVKQKAVQDVEWQEECELAIPTQGNTAEIVLTALHQNFIGVDEFLGMAILPLSQFDVYERPRTKWYPLKSKPGQEGKNKQRGEIEVRVAFTVKSGSLLDLSKKEKHKGSLGHIAQAAHHFGGSLMSLGKEKKGGIKKLASSVGSKLRLPKSGRDDKSDGRLSRHSSGRFSDKFSGGEPDPGVISEDEDEFRFDELSHKSSASSLNLAGGSSLASAQGSLENLGGGELLRRNSMKRSGSSATLPNRALQASSSNLSIASSGGGANKSSSQAQPSTPQQTSGGNDWKLFGSKHAKVSQPEEAPAASNSLNNGSPSWKASNESETVVTSGVPSIIIQDSFVIEKPSLSPSSSPSSRSSSSTAPVPRARTSNTKEALKDLDDDFPSVYTSIPNRKDHEEPAVVAVPAAVSKGEQAEDALERKQLSTRMPPFFPPPSFPAGEPAPVPKPRRSPAPGLYEEEPVLPPVSVQPVPPPRKFFDNFLDNFIDTSPKNPFESDSEPESDQSGSESGAKPEAFERTNVLVLSSLDEEPPLDEDGVCDLLEKAIEEHDEPKNAGPGPFTSTIVVNQEPVEFEPPAPVSVRFNGREEQDKSRQLESEVMIDSPPVGQKEENVVRVLNIIKSGGSATNSEDEAHEYSDGEPTVDFFNDQTVPISPVEKFGIEPGSVLLPIGTPKETPVSKVIRRDRLFSLMSTPNSEPDPDQVSVDQPNIRNTPVIDLNWLDGSPESDRSSHGFGGSEQLSSATSQAESAKTGDSAVFVSDSIDNSRMDTTGTNPSKHSPDQHAPETTPPANQSKQTTPASGASNKADMSWDMYDMRYLPTPPTGAVAAERKSLAPSEVSAVGQDGRKRISLAPCLKTLELGTPTGNISDAASPLPDIDDDDEALADEQAATSPATNEAHRLKMAASLHQRVVVGEDKPVNNNATRDSRLPHDSPSAEDRHRIYQGRSRDGLISLLEDRDAEIADLKDYIDSLLLRVIDSCPTILQTPIKTSRNHQSRK